MPRSCETCSAEVPKKCRFCAACNKTRHRSRSRACEARRREQDPSYRAQQARYHRDRRAAQPEVAQRHRDQARSYCAQNRKTIARYAERWRANNIEKIKQDLRAWHVKNPGYNTAKGSVRRALIFSAGSVGVTHAEWLVILETFNHACAYCLRKGLKLTRDHVIPVTRGGLDNPENVVPACKWCNSSKGNKVLVVWYCARFAA